MKKNIYLSVLLTSISLSAIANPEVTGKFTFESARYTSDGTTVGSATTNHGSGGAAATTATSHGTETFKNELSARIYIDGSLDNGDAYHAELQGYNNSKAVTGLDNNESYTQRDPLRELYIDTSYDDWQLRAGKQQVVWGTADGMKLLDIVNPTDYTEMAQNQMEDSRITTFMLNAEKIQEDGSSIQIVASQPRENIFAGFDRNIKTGIRANGDYAANGTGGSDATTDGLNFKSPFILKGVDTITGKYNGFLNIVPDLGAIAGKFAWGFGKESAMVDPRMAGFTVSAFESMKMGGTVAGAGALAVDAGSYMPAAMNLVSSGNGGSMLCRFDGDDTYTASGGTTYDGDTVSNSTCPTGVTNANFDITSLATKTTFNYTDLPDNFEGAIIGVAAALNGWSWTPSTQVLKDPNGTTRNPATYAPFIALANAVTGEQMIAYGFQGGYNTSLADTDTVDDTAFDYMGTTNFKTFDTFVGANSEYVYDMPSDADLDLAARYRNTTEDGLNYSLVASYNYDKNPVIDLSWRGTSGQLLTQSTDGYGAIVLKDGNSVYGGSTSDRPTLRFTQTLKRARNIGGAFDMAIENETLGPIVIRGEALYQNGVYSPIVDKSKLVIGDLVGALKMEKGNRLKYVLGADITALTNMMVSVQLIQDRNLSYVDGNQSTGRYTADFASMHLTNGLNKAEKNKEFYSIFLSKPFGSSGQHRWNNIMMLEEGDGRWNRLDVEYTIDDNTVATAEWNRYWGNENTQFGQLKAASNLQLGLKYSF